MIYGLVMMCLIQPSPGSDECKVFYVQTYQSEAECLVGIEQDVILLESSLPAKAEDKVCFKFNRKPNA